MRVVAEKLGLCEPTLYFSHRAHVKWRTSTSLCSHAEFVNTMLVAIIEIVTDTFARPVVHFDRGIYHHRRGWLLDLNGKTRDGSAGSPSCHKCSPLLQSVSRTAVIVRRVGLKVLRIRPIRLLPSTKAPTNPATFLMILNYPYNRLSERDVVGAIVNSTAEVLETCSNGSLDGSGNALAVLPSAVAAPDVTPLRFVECRASATTWLARCAKSANLCPSLKRWRPVQNMARFESPPTPGVIAWTN